MFFACEAWCIVDVSSVSPSSEQILCRLTNVTRLLNIIYLSSAGTGKTLMARQIGKMLNTREPKIISGPGRLSSLISYMRTEQNTLVSSEGIYELSTT